MPYVVVAFRLVVALVFIVAGWAKAKDPQGFASIVKAFGILPEEPSKWLARFLPWVELAVGAALVAGVMVRLAALVAALLLLVFIIAIAVTLRRGKTTECGCFGTKRPTRVGLGLLVRNFLLTAMLIPVYLLNGGPIITRLGQF